MNHLNQRKSPSAPLVSQEIETDFFRRRFFPIVAEVPEVADVTIVAGGEGVLGEVRELASDSTRVRGVFMHGERR